MVNFPVEDPMNVAVVSWRWDIDEDHTSRNLYSALIYAKSVQLRHIFIDVVSIDQRLKGDKLLQQVCLFTDLYRTIPVIAAYDRASCDLLRSMQRPWIANEIMALKYNPTYIVSLRHNCTEQPKIRSYLTHLPKYVPDPDDAFLGWDTQHGFTAKANMIWWDGLVISIMQMLFGTGGMADISDLRYILPAHAHLLAGAHKRFQRNDYLLTAALLTRTDYGFSGYYGGPSMKYGAFNIAQREFKRYLIVEVAESLAMRTHADVFFGPDAKEPVGFL